MDEMAFSLDGENAHYGAPENPAAPGRAAGGSSTGSAVGLCRQRQLKSEVGREKPELDTALCMRSWSNLHRLAEGHRTGVRAAAWMSKFPNFSSVSSCR